jgi:fructose-bisphosphate aldolase class I
LAGFPGEKITEGLDGLRNRLQDYSQLGARFAKWRAVITIAEGLPTPTCIHANMHLLARYAAICQDAGMVPIVEPEVLMDGSHTIERCAAVTEETLHELFSQLYAQRVEFGGLLLKCNMVLPGKECPAQASADQIAHATVACLLRSVPAAVPGITFLSGGQRHDEASARLNAMNVRFGGRVPWALAFSFSRAIQQPAMEAWRGQDANTELAQQILLHRARCNRAARRGAYSDSMEREQLPSLHAVPGRTRL